ncbi:MAG: class C beta-lactamase, partial [Pseudomonadota bacterium]
KSALPANRRRLPQAIARVNCLSRVTLASLALATPLHAEPISDERFQTIAGETFRPIIEEYNLPGIAIGASLDGQNYFFTAGVADQANAAPVTSQTLFELGSISKLFNVTLAAWLDAEGALSLETVVSDLVPELQGSAFDRIELEDLAAHANGGLPLQVPESIKNQADLIQWLSDWKTEGDPTSLRSYSNISIGLLGRISGAQCCASYEAALAERLLPALGLKNTFITVPSRKLSRYAFGYAQGSDAPIRVNPGMLDAEAYGVKSSVTDMVRFIDAHLGRTQVSDTIVAALVRTRQASYDTAYFAQAMIWEEYPWPVDRAQLSAGNGNDMILSAQPITTRDGPVIGPTLFSKTGSTNGFGAYIAVVPSEDIGIVVLANRRYPNAVRAVATLTLMQGLLAEKSD